MNASPGLRAALIAAPLAIVGLGASLWLWARYGMGVYFDAMVAAIAACL